MRLITFKYTVREHSPVAGISCHMSTGRHCALLCLCAFDYGNGMQITSIGWFDSASREENSFEIEQNSRRKPRQFMSIWSVDYSTGN